MVKVDENLCDENVVLWTVGCNSFSLVLVILVEGRNSGREETQQYGHGFCSP